MQLLSVLSVLTILWCVAIHAQQPDCRVLRERCESCVRRLNNPSNNVEFMNNGCRERLRRTYHWRNQTRCDLQVIACSAHRRKLDCAVIAELAGMRRRT
ncbi:uncharacterized protein [Drosophila pseudoobscura]|uniref:Uncharacterized protein n=1 Tax=Drosophila pseudoobscura pseudoobscura TaxID=46245 RepID=A0A6I8UCA5_DROPS|nr:uncharacterized protein LOC4812968 [Drosophila pseudoobscura]